MTSSGHFDDRQPQSLTSQPQRPVEQTHVPLPTAPNQALHATSLQVEAGRLYRSRPEVSIARALEHKRDRVFRRHGLRTVERYDASACLRSADRLVSDFLKLVQWRASA